VELCHIYGGDGKTMISTIAQGQDITDRKQAEDALSTAKDLLEHQVFLLQQALIPHKPRL